MPRSTSKLTTVLIAAPVMRAVLRIEFPSEDSHDLGSTLGVQLVHNDCIIPDRSRIEQALPDG